MGSRLVIPQYYPPLFILLAILAHPSFTCFTPRSPLTVIAGSLLFLSLFHWILALIDESPLVSGGWAPVFLSTPLILSLFFPKLLVFFTNLTVVCLLTLAGRSVGKNLKFPEFLRAAAILVFCTDFWSVYFGPTRELLKSGHIKFFLLYAPVPLEGRVSGFMGIIDIFFVALFLASPVLATDAEKSAIRRSFAIGSVVAFITGFFLKIPLPLMGVYSPIYLFFIRGKNGWGGRDLRLLTTGFVALGLAIAFFHWKYPV